ncbi:hypothetical protein N5079_02195 [Planotetraspora sp. A-T 1434]|uniref:hypothetical protein n=1 Tax=Planotetraspora sp. A-T 1434 TaxID=2979219 RepID=UPI0021C160C1|nr:hypothetical protein [Planotetraspora sp. A-T 1434]MCT9929024.1 hypothetical protein [Planotetraspora sp. A-T 1434]
MRRCVGYTLAWCGATALAVGVSWLGVRDVLRSTVLDEAPLAPVVAVAGAVAPTVTAAVPLMSPAPLSPAPRRHTSPTTKASPWPRTLVRVSPARHSPSSPASPSSRPRSTAGSTTKASARPTVRPTAQPTGQSRPTPSPTGESLHTFTLKGGRATIAVTDKDCRVVTATPNDGYELKVWENVGWLRVTFLQGTHESSAFCTWNALPPRLDTYET